MPRDPNAISAKPFVTALLRYTEAELDKADSNRDGRLSRTEVNTLPERLRNNLHRATHAGRPSDKQYISSLMFHERWELDTFVRTRDVNRDGQLSQYEFRGPRFYGMGRDDDLESFGRAARGEGTSEDLWALPTPPAPPGRIAPR